MFKECINKMGKEQIQAAQKIIICNDNPYFIAKYSEKQSRFDQDPYIAIIIYKNGANSLVSAGSSSGYWHFDNLNTPL